MKSLNFTELHEMLTVNMSLTVYPVRTRADLKKFVLLPWKIYRDDPIWVPPLISERLQFLNRKKNPFFEHGEAEYFLAKRDDKIVGRISAQIDHLHNKTHSEKTGFFGFFESINDQEVATALLDNASQWLRRHDMMAIRGPFSFNINDESGLLVKGFEYPPYIMMGCNPPYYATLFQDWGLIKKKDLFCWWGDYSRPMPEILKRITETTRSEPRIRIREITPKSIREDFLVLRDIFNSAWRNNWGFIPVSKSDALKLAKDFKHVIEPSLSFIAEVNGQAAAIFISVPNLNEVLKDLNGRLFPIGFFKLLYRLKRRKFRSTRLIVVGIKKESRATTGNSPETLLAILLKENYERSKELGILEGEGSWTLEDNLKINNITQAFGMKHYKTYRIYERELL